MTLKLHALKNLIVTNFKILLMRVLNLFTYDYPFEGNDQNFIEDEIKSNSERLKMFKNIKFKCLDINKNPFQKKFDAAYLLDVFEHVNPKDSKKFIKNIYKSLIKKSILIIGVPNITANKYASKNSKKNHINLMNQKDLKKLLSKYFEHNLIFGMNDEVLHTGFFPMAQYIFIVSINKKKL